MEACVPASDNQDPGHELRLRWEHVLGNADMSGLFRSVARGTQQAALRWPPVRARASLAR